MKHEIIIIADKIETKKCKSHSEAAKIKIVRTGIQISSCCVEFKNYLERQIEYEFYKLFSKEEDEL